MRDDQALQRFRSAIAAADTVEALRMLRAQLEHPRRPDVDGPTATTMAYEFAVAAGEHPPGTAPSWDDPGGLLDLGRALLRAGLPQVAATVLLRAHELEGDDHEISLSAASALLTVGDPARAHDVVKRARLHRPGDVVAAYLAAFAALATADLDHARDVLDTAPPPANTAERLLLARVEGMYARADLLAGASRLGTTDLRGWHYVLTAGVLLQCSPYGVDMNGRYGYLTDTAAHCRLAIDALQVVVEGLGLAVPRVVAADDPDSRILAEAAARLLALPAVDRWDDAADEPGLLVVYRLADQPPDLVHRLRRHEPGRVLWVHSACWTREEAVAGDVASHLAALIRPQWRTDGAPGRPDTDRWVARIVEAEPAEQDASDRHDLRDLLDVIAASDADDRLRPAATRVSGERLRQWAVSPVSSARF